MTKQRKLKRGQIFLNLWAGQQSLFVISTVSKDRCYGTNIFKANGKFQIHNGEHYTYNLKHDEEHFKLVGEIDIDAMWIDTVFGQITQEGHKIMEENYHFDGHRLVAGEMAECQNRS